MPRVRSAKPTISSLENGVGDVVVARIMSFDGFSMSFSVAVGL